MPEDAQSFDPNNRRAFLTRASKLLKCKDEEFVIAAAWINQVRNFGSATSTIFGLGYKDHKEYLQRASKKLQEYLPEGTVATPEWLGMFRDEYIKSVEKYPV